MASSHQRSPPAALVETVSHITSAFLIMLPECNIRSSLSSHLHSFIHSSHFFFFVEGYTSLLQSVFTYLPRLFLFSLFLLFSSKFSCVIPSPRTPLISPLPLCLRNTDKRKRTAERGMAGQRERERGTGSRKRKGERGKKKNRAWG